MRRICNFIVCFVVFGAMTGLCLPQKRKCVVKSHENISVISLLDTIVNENHIRIEYHIDSAFEEYRVNTLNYPLYIYCNNHFDSFLMLEEDESYYRLAEEFLESDSLYFTSLWRFNVIRSKAVTRQHVFWGDSYFVFSMQYGSAAQLVFVDIKGGLVKISRQVLVFQGNFILFPKERIVGLPNNTGKYTGKTILIKYDSSFKLHDCNIFMNTIPRENGDYKSIISSYSKFADRLSKCKKGINDHIVNQDGKYVFIGYH